MGFLFLMILNFVMAASGWQFFTTLGDLVMTDSDPGEIVSHSEYIFGHCKEIASLKFYTHQYLNHMDVLGKTIVRGWLDLYRIPTCIILRAKAFKEHTFRSTSYNFQICVPRIVYCHSKQRIKYFYYEWYIPSDMVGGMDWDIYFFGPPNREW